MFNPPFDCSRWEKDDSYFDFSLVKLTHGPLVVNNIGLLKSTSLSAKGRSVKNLLNESFGHLTFCTEDCEII